MFSSQKPSTNNGIILHQLQSRYSVQCSIAGTGASLAGSPLATTLVAEGITNASKTTCVGDGLAGGLAGPSPPTQDRSLSPFYAAYIRDVPLYLLSVCGIKCGI